MTYAATAVNFDGTLTTSDYGKLEARWINRELAALAMLRRVDSLTGREIVGRKSGNYAEIAIPFVHPVTKYVVEQCIRRDEPDIEIHHGKGKEVRKYILPPGSKNRIFFGEKRKRSPPQRRAARREPAIAGLSWEAGPGGPLRRRGGAASTWPGIRSGGSARG